MPYYKRVFAFLFLSVFLCMYGSGNVYGQDPVENPVDESEEVVYGEDESIDEPDEEIERGDEEIWEFPVRATETSTGHDLLLRSEVLPWGLTIANVGAEYFFADRWSVAMDVWFCPWKISDKFSVKTVSILPEGRWWLKPGGKGSFFNVHLDIAWYNVRANAYRYQDRGRPLLGGGIGYGYRLNLKGRWGLEFEIGAGIANMKYDRFYNVNNGSLKDTRVSTYFGIDRAAVTVTYYLCDL